MSRKDYALIRPTKGENGKFLATLSDEAILSLSNLDRSEIQAVEAFIESVVINMELEAGRLIDQHTTDGKALIAACKVEGARFVRKQFMELLSKASPLLGETQ